MSPVYIAIAWPTCRKLLLQFAEIADALAPLNPAIISEANTAMMAITTNNSTSVNAWLRWNRACIPVFNVRATTCRRLKAKRSYY